MTLSVLVTIISEVSESSAVLVLYRDYVAHRINKATMQTRLRELVTRDHLKMSVLKYYHWCMGVHECDLCYSRV